MINAIDNNFSPIYNIDLELLEGEEATDSFFEKKNFNHVPTNVMLESSEILSPGMIPNLIDNNIKKSDEIDNFHESNRLNQQQKNQKILGNLKDAVKNSFKNKFKTMKNLSSNDKNSINFQKKKGNNYSQSILHTNSPNQIININFSKNLVNISQSKQPANKSNNLYQSITIKTARSQVHFNQIVV